MKVIFLDIDGVLNCDAMPNPRDLPYVLDKKLLARLHHLLDRTRAKPYLVLENRSCWTFCGEVLESDALHGRLSGYARSPTV